MAMLDRKRPFGEIFGIHRAKYTQDGMMFDGRGRMLGEKAAPAAIVTETVPLDKLSISELKAAVRQAGGEYTNRVEAIEYLKNREDDLS